MNNLMCMRLFIVAAVDVVAFTLANYGKYTPFLPFYPHITHSAIQSNH